MSKCFTEYLAQSVMTYVDKLSFKRQRMDESMHFESFGMNENERERASEKKIEKNE